MALLVVMPDRDPAELVVVSGAGAGRRRVANIATTGHEPVGVRGIVCKPADGK